MIPPLPAQAGPAGSPPRLVSVHAPEPSIYCALDADSLTSREVRFYDSLKIFLRSQRINLAPIHTDYRLSIIDYRSPVPRAWATRTVRRSVFFFLFFFSRFFLPRAQVRFDDALRVDLASTQFPVRDPEEDAYYGAYGREK